MAKAICKVLGVAFVLIGAVVVLRGAPVDPYHNLLHVATGFVALAFGFAGSASAARGFCSGFGLFYFAFGLVGLVAGDPNLNWMLHAGPLNLDRADHLFHVALGSALLAASALTRAKRGARGRRAEPTSSADTNT